MCDSTNYLAAVFTYTLVMKIKLGKNGSRKKQGRSVLSVPVYYDILEKMHMYVFKGRRYSLHF